MNRSRATAIPARERRPVLLVGAPRRPAPLPLDRGRPTAVLVLVGLLVTSPGIAQPLADARRLLREGRPAEALDPLAAAFGADPDSGEGRALLWALARGAPPQPGFVDAFVAAADRLGPDGWIAAGVLLRRGLRPLDALEAFDRAVAVRPALDPAADIEAGRLLAELRSHELALARFDRHPEHREAMHGQAVVLARMRQTARAFALVDALVADDPGNPRAVLLRAELLDSVGRGSEALDPLRALVAVAGPASPAGFRLARILVKLRASEEALPILEAILGANPGDAEAWFALGGAHDAAGRPEDAASAFRRALAEDPAQNEARFRLARRLVREGDRDGADELFAEFERREAIEEESGRLLGEAELDPSDTRRVDAFVSHALAVANWGLALHGSQRFLIEFPDDPARHLLLARVFREGGRIADAERVLRRGIARFAGDAEAVRRFEAGLRAIGAESRIPSRPHRSVAFARSIWARTARGAVPPRPARASTDRR